jgi:hypothetical protein
MSLRRIGQTVGNDIFDLPLSLFVPNVLENLSSRVEFSRTRVGGHIWLEASRSEIDRRGNCRCRLLAARRDSKLHGPEDIFQVFDAAASFSSLMYAVFS